MSNVLDTLVSCANGAFNPLNNPFTLALTAASVYPNAVTPVLAGMSAIAGCYIKIQQDNPDTHILEAFIAQLGVASIIGVVTVAIEAQV